MSKILKATLRSTGVAFFFSLVSGCSIVATRPIQEMSDTVAAMKAAREVQADTKATEYYRLSEELYFKARQEYRLKNFARAKKLADQARDAAEKAEFLSIRGGATRHSLTSVEPLPPPPPITPQPEETGNPTEPPPTAPTP